MESLKKWLVALDLTGHDHSILRYTKMLYDVLCPEHVEFVFIAKRLADGIHIHLPEKLQYPAYDDLLAKIDKEVYQYFSKSDPISFEVLDGPVQFDLWKEAYIKDIDLFIAGSKPKHKGRGLFPRKFVRKSFCSVLLIPAEVPENLTKIWVPIDFSEQSGEALQLAIQIAKGTKPQAEVCAHHVYQLPHAYYYKDFPQEEILNAVRLAAEDQFKEFNGKYNPEAVSIFPVLTEMLDSYAANNIKKEAQAEDTDLMVMASGGKSRFTNLFLGSETEYLIQNQITVPLLILKKKAEQVKLWDLFSVNY